MIEEVHIKNFRSIKDLTIKPSQLSAIIGPNSCGKSNVLKAIELVLSEKWTTKSKVKRELFNDPKKDIEIKITFDESITAPQDNHDDQEVKTIKLVMALNPKIKAKTTINGGNTFYGHENFKKLCHFIYIPAERNLSSELRVSQRTMLGKMMKRIYDNYIEEYGDEKKLKKDFKNEIEPAKKFLEKDFSQDKLTFKKFVDTIKEKCNENNIGLANKFEPILDIYDLNGFYKTLQIHVSETGLDKQINSQETGAGMQNLLMLSIFQTYAELMGEKVIFGIEEPEIYLYPQAQRALYKNFIELSDNSQIFYTTHNPNFVNASRPNDIFLLRKDNKAGTYKLEQEPHFTSENAEKHKHKIYTHFNTERNELFFAKRVLLVEGDSDKILFATLCEKKRDIDLDRKGISIISCNGKGGVNYFVGVCKLIGMKNFFAVWDEDPDDDSYQPKRDYLKTIKSKDNNNKGLEIKGDLETFLSITGNEKVKDAYERASKVKKSEIPKDFDMIKEFLM